MDGERRVGGEGVCAVLDHQANPGGFRNILSAAGGKRKAPRVAVSAAPRRKKKREEASYKGSVVRGVGVMQEPKAGQKQATKHVPRLVHLTRPRTCTCDV